MYTIGIVIVMTTLQLLLSVWCSRRGQGRCVVTQSMVTGDAAGKTCMVMWQGEDGDDSHACVVSAWWCGGVAVSVATWLGGDAACSSPLPVTCHAATNLQLLLWLSVHVIHVELACGEATSEWVVVCESKKGGGSGSDDDGIVW